MKFSEYVREALKDVAAVIQHPDYRLDGNVWYAGEGYDKCHVCLAGAVMAKELNYSTFKNHGIDDFPDIEHKLAALNSFREGSLVDAYKRYHKNDNWGDNFGDLLVGVDDLYDTENLLRVVGNFTGDNQASDFVYYALDVLPEIEEVENKSGYYA